MLKLSDICNADLYTHLTPSDQDAVVTLAYLSCAEDGRLGEAEISLLTDALGLVYGPDIDSEAMVQERFLVHYTANSLVHDELPERLRDAASAVKSSFARKIAYKLVYAMSLGDDLATDWDEYEVCEVLKVALQLSPEAIQALEDQVDRVLAAV